MEDGQRAVVKDQQASITTLMQHVDDLQSSIKAKDAEITSLRDRCAAQHAEISSRTAPSASSPEDVSLAQELQKQKQNVKRVQDQLTAALERERVLQQHVAQLQRKLFFYVLHAVTTFRAVHPTSLNKLRSLYSKVHVESYLMGVWSPLHLRSLNRRACYRIAPVSFFYHF